MLRNKKILITGATGFVGANIVHRFLTEGASVIIFTRKTSNKWRIKDILKDVAEYSVDLLDESELENTILHIKPEIIFHTATYGGYPFQCESKKIFGTNCIGTVNLVNACRKIDFGLFVNMGSSSEYGIKHQPMKENDWLEPITDYGVSKAFATLYCQAVAKRENKSIVTFRLFSPYGYYEASIRLIPSLIISCLKGRNPEVSSPNPVRDFIFIEDLIDSYVKAIENKGRIIGEVFNVGYSRQHSVGEVVDEIIKLIGNKVNPEWESISNPRVEPKIWQADISKAKKLLSWQPKYDLTHGLKKTINWFKENIELYR